MAVSTDSGDEESDFVDAVIAKRTRRDPGFSDRVEAARRRRELLRGLAELREERGQSQTAVAAAMATSQSAIARLEGAASDARLSTIDRYAATLGYVVQYQLVPAESAEGVAPVVVQEG